MKRKKKLVHKGIFYDSRVNQNNFGGKREKIFADGWKKENELIQRFPTVICSRLEAIMVKDDKFLPVSQESASIVATVVQWFGSPVGFAFLQKTLREAGYVIYSKDSPT